MAVYAKVFFTNQTVSGDQISGDVNIGIFDVATDLPVDANNREVLFDLTDSSGLPYSSSVTVVGMFSKIYTGLISEDSPYYLINVVITDIGEEGSGTGSNQCDVQIIEIEILTPESSAGANDGSVKVKASSTYGPIQFSIDAPGDISYDSVFTGLGSGVHTAYAKDANDCEINLVFTLPLVTDLMTDGPDVTDSGHTSRWNAAFNPIVFKFQRKDLQVIGVTDWNGYANVEINGDISNVKYGDLVYLQSEDYDLVARVIGYYNVANDLQLDTPYVADTTGGFVNIDSLRKYYYVELFINYLSITDQAMSITAPFASDAKGLIEADISGFLKNILSTQDLSDYSLPNFRDRNLGASYSVSFREVWDGHIGETVEIADPFYVTFAARQLGQKYGGNMYDFVPDNDKVAKFLCDFNEPLYSDGYPFDIGFIYSELILGEEVKSNIQYLDINRDVIGSVDQSVLTNEDTSFILNTDGSKFIITDQTNALDGGILPEQLGVNRLRLVATLPVHCYFMKVWLSIDDVAITEEKIVRVDRNCEDTNSVYVRWMGLTGSWQYYRFNFSHSQLMDVQSIQSVREFVSNWETQKNIEKVIAKNAGEKINIEAVQIDVNDITGLKYFLTSIEAQILTQASPVKWQTVIVNNGVYGLLDSRNATTDFRCTFNLPSINIQTQ